MLKEEIKYFRKNEWGRIGNGDPNIAASALYEYGKIRLLHQENNVKSLPIYWGKTTFTCKDDIWGVEFEWVKDLIAGNRFVFIFIFEILPDIILADGNIVWQSTQNEAARGKVIFSYVPDKSGPVTISFLKDASYSEPNIADNGIRFGDFTGCLKLNTCEPVKYESYNKLSSLTRTTVTPVLTNRDYFEEALVEPDFSPLPKVKWRTMKVDVLNETLDAYLPDLAHYTKQACPEHIQNLIDTIPLLEANGINGMMLYHLTGELLEALAKSSLRSFIVETCSAGEWWGPCGSDTHCTRPQYSMGLDICNRLLDRIGDCHVYVWFPEIDERQRDLFRSPEWKAKLEHNQHGLGSINYDDTTDNEFWKTEKMAEANCRWKKEYWEKLNDPERVTAIYQAGNPFMIADFKNAGSDMTVNKSIFRSCFNTTVAAGRGTMKAHEQPHGFDYDPWSWRFRMNHHPNEWKQGLKVYLHAGCSFLFHEGTLFRRDTKGQMKPTETGQAFCETIRYARQHPTVGKQIAKMAAMQGSGDHTRHLLPRFMPQCAVEHGHPADWFQLSYSDWSLLDIFFPNMGNWIVGNMERLMTGTPYGPLDIIPCDTTFEYMKEYDFVFIIGTNGCTPQQLDAFTQYVENGGTLVLALGQLKRKEIIPRRIITGDLEHFAGVTVDLETEAVNVKTATVLHRFDNGSSLLLNRVGKGKVYLFTTNTLTTMGEVLPRNILQELATKANFTSFEPFSDWLEIMVNRKGQAVSLCIFNHGQIGFPSGNGSKTPVWHGTISIDYRKLGLSEDIIVKKVEDGYKLCDIPAEVINGRIVFEETVDCFAEFVLGPKNQLEQDWLGGL